VASQLVRTVVVGALLLVLPFGGMRVICIAESEEPAATSSEAVAPPEQPKHEVTECERLCPLHATDSSSSDSDSQTERCGLSAGASSLMAAAGIAVVRPLVPPPLPSIVRSVYVETGRFMPDPDLPRFAPPPKPDTL
jgi:hypothetical protein